MNCSISWKGESLGMYIYSILNGVMSFICITASIIIVEKLVNSYNLAIEDRLEPQNDQLLHVS